MINNLSESIKKRFIYELRRFWQYDPNYGDIVRHIQGKYSFRERPQHGIILKNSSASPFQLSADNFQGTVVSYVYIQKVGNFPGLAVEWVREDGRAIQDNGGDFPTARGLYYIAVEQEEVDIGGQPQERLVFYVDPLLEVIDEAPMQVSGLTWQLANTDIHPGSLRLYELPGNIQLYEGENYTVDNDTGLITLTTPLPSGVWLSADYRHPGTSSGPYLIRENHTNVKAIPGVVLAFGRRVAGGDRQVVVIQDRRSPVALEYGGRWEVSLDFDIMARDPVAQGEITDKTLLYLWGVLRNRLSTEGIEITQVNGGGESEEVYDENGDDYFYNASFSVNLLTDWAIHVPLDPAIRAVTPQTVENAAAVATLTGDDLVENEETTLQAVDDLRLVSAQDPYFRGRNRNYEVIK